MGSQTGDSLYGPSSGASLVTLRGTDGLESGTGVMPLSYLTDFGGVIARSVPDLADMLNVVVAVDPDDPETSAPGRHTPADWRSVLDPNALRGKRIGYIPSTWVDPFGTTNTTDAEKAALQYLVDAGATIVEMGVTVGGADTPTAPADAYRRHQFGGLGALHRQSSRAGHPGLQDLHRGRRELLAEEGRLRASGPERLLGHALAALDTGPDPGLSGLSARDTGNCQNVDGHGGRRSAWRRRRRLSGAVERHHPQRRRRRQSELRPSRHAGCSNGIPTVIFPVGYDNEGQPINIQLLGRAWDDDKLVGMAYAFEEIANAAGHGHVEAITAPALSHGDGKHISNWGAESTAAATRP